MKSKLKNLFLEQLKKVPIVSVASEKAGLSRNTIYTWRKKNKKFEEEMDKAMAEGVDLINDAGEAQLLNFIKNESWPALAFWLKHRNQKFKDKLEVTTKVEQETLTPEQEALVKKALSFGLSNNDKNKNEK